MQVDGTVDMGCRSSSVGIVTVYSLDDQGVGVRFLTGTRDVSVVHSVQTCSGADLPVCHIGTGGCYTGIK